MNGTFLKTKQVVNSNEHFGSRIFKSMRKRYCGGKAVGFL